MDTKLEVRFIPATEVRLVTEEGQAPKLVGHAAVYNVFSNDLGGFKEIIRPGTFTRTLANNADVRLLINHEGLPLARSSSKTLQLKEDQRGLAFTATLDPTDPDVQRIMPKIKRGDLGEMSFAFTTMKDSWRSENGQDIRELQDVDLYDVSVVTYPAYPAADCAVRSHQEWKKQQDQQKNKQTAGQTDLLKRKLQVAELE